LLAERGTSVTYETIRTGCAKCGPSYAAGLRWRCARPSHTWRLDEVQLKIKGAAPLAVACGRHARVVLDIFIQQRRDQQAAETFLCSVVASPWSEPRVVITDSRLSYPPALRRVLPNVDHRRHKGLNNRAENSHQPTRQRERVMRRFKSPEHAQRFLGPFGAVGDHFRVGRYTAPAGTRRQLLVERQSTWQEVVGIQVAAREYLSVRTPARRPATERHDAPALT